MLDVVAALAAAGVAVSIDTMRATVAERCVAAGAVLVNDVTGGLGDEAMLATVAGLGVPYVVMHWRGPSAVMDELARYDDVVAEVVAELAARSRRRWRRACELERIVVDPGIGFAKTAAHNWALLQRLDALVALGRPVLVGASRKRFLSAARRHRRTRRRHRSGVGTRRGGGRVGRPRPRTGRQPGRRQGGHGVAGRSAEMIAAFAQGVRQRHRRGARWR